MVKIQLLYILVINLISFAFANAEDLAKPQPTASAKSATSVPCTPPEFNPSDYILPKTITVLKASGDISYGPIKLSFVRPEIGGKVPTLYEKDKKITHPAPYTMSWLDEKKLSLNAFSKFDPIVQGQAFSTSADGLLSLEMSDQTKVDLGSNTVFEIKALQGDGLQRKVLLRLLKGTIHIQIPNPITDLDQFIIETPNAVVHHRGAKYSTKEKGNAFFLNVSTDTENFTTTFIFTEHGQQSVDIFKTSLDGTLYSNTAVLSPLNFLELRGRYGTAQEISNLKQFKKNDTIELDKIKKLFITE